MATDLFFVHGIPKGIGKSALDSLPKALYLGKALPFYGLSQGELYLSILSDRANILKSYYGDPYGHITDSINVLESALFKGLNSPGVLALDKRISSASNWAAKAVRDAKRFSNTIVGGKRISPIEKTTGKVAIAGSRGAFNSPFDLNSVSQQTIQNLIVDLMSKTGSSEFAVINSSEFKQRSAAITTALPILNKEWTTQGHHVLYEYLNDASVTSTEVKIKAQNHRLSFDFMSNYSEVPRDIIRAWTNNGIMRCNIEQGINPFMGFESIDILGQLAFASEEQTASIGVIDPASVTLATKILGAVITALAVAKEIVNLIRDIQISTKSYGLPSNQPQKTDFTKSNIISQSQFDLKSIAIPAAIGLTALWALSGKD